jgi:O-antigen/teichoic acid export membrane protein
MSTKGHRVARNALLNFAGQCVLLVIGVWALPVIARGLGTDRFGVLMLSLAVLSYLTLFDLGLSRAIVKLAAESFSKDEHSRIARITWTAQALLLLFGAAGGVLLVVFTYLFAGRAFAIPAALFEETRRTFVIVALTVPIITCATGFQGLFQALQRFDLVNAVRTANGAAKLLLLVLMAYAGWRLPAIALALLLVEVARLLAYLIIALTVVPSLRRVSLERGALRELTGFGSWLSVSTVAGVTIAYLDRFLIASLLGMSALSHYAIPAEVIGRLWIAVTAVTAALFPVFSADTSARTVEIYAHAMRLTLLVVMPVAIVLTVFGGELMTLWTGPTFAAQAGRVLQLLAPGFAIGAAGRIAQNFVLALGYPDVMAKFHLIELGLFGFLAVVLTRAMKIDGMALAWTLRTAVETGFVLAVLRAKHPQVASALTRWGIAHVFSAGALLLIVTVAVKLVAVRPLLMLGVAALCVGGFGLAAWQVVLYPSERAALLAAVNFWRRPVS